MEGPEGPAALCQLEPEGTRLIQGSVPSKRDFPAEAVLLCSTTTAFVSGSGVPLSSLCSSAPAQVPGLCSVSGNWLVLPN